MRTSIPILSVIIVLLISGCSTSTISPGCNPDDYPAGSSQWHQCIQANSDQATSGYNTLADCEDAKSKVTCYEQVAVKTNDFTVCDMIMEVYASEITVYGCYSRVGIENNNVEACDRIVEAGVLSANSCYYDIARKTGDESICYGIVNEDVKNSCIQEI